MLTCCSNNSQSFRQGHNNPSALARASSSDDCKSERRSSRSTSALFFFLLIHSEALSVSEDDCKIKQSSKSFPENLPGSSLKPFGVNLSQPLPLLVRLKR